MRRAPRRLFSLQLPDYHQSAAPALALTLFAELCAFGHRTTTNYQRATTRRVYLPIADGDAARRLLFSFVALPLNDSLQSDMYACYRAIISTRVARHWTFSTGVTGVVLHLDAAYAHCDALNRRYHHRMCQHEDIISRVSPYSW